VREPNGQEVLAHERLGYVIQGHGRRRLNLACRTAQHCWIVSRSFDRVDDLLGHGMMEHVSDTRNQPQRAVRNVSMEPDSVFPMIDDAILRAGHNHYGHAQFPVTALHREDCRNHRGSILSLGADLRWP